VKRKQDEKDAKLLDKETRQSEKRGVRFAEEGVSEDEKQVGAVAASKKAAAALISGVTKEVEEFEDFGDVDFDGAKDARAMPKQQKGLQLVKDKKVPTGAILGKKRARPSK
jgi:hypothetical protein